MKLLRRSKPRYTVERNEDSVTITITSRRGVFHLIFYGFFILYWFYFLAGLGVFWGMLALFLASPKTAQPFTIVLFLFLSFLQSFLLFLGFKIPYYLLREWTGKEIIEIDKTRFMVSLQILDWRKSKTYAIQKINKIQILKKPGMFSINPPWRKRYEEKISFDSDEKTYRFGFWLKEKEANEILPIIQGLLDEMRNV